MRESPPVAMSSQQTYEQCEVVLSKGADCVDVCGCQTSVPSTAEIQTWNRAMDRMETIRKPSILKECSLTSQYDISYLM